MGLREDKQRRQRDELIENAFAYMREQAGEPPSMTRLARLAGISDATVFNYLGQREAVLCEIAHRNLDELISTEAQGGALRRGLRRVSRALRRQLDRDSPVWLRVWASTSPLDPAVGRPGAVARTAMRQLLESAQTRGELRQDVPADLLAQTVLDGWLAALAREARRARDARDGPGAGATIDDAGWERVETAAELVLDGLQKRHERVRPRPGERLRARARGAAADRRPVRVNPSAGT